MALRKCVNISSCSPFLNSLRCKFFSPASSSRGVSTAAQAAASSTTFDASSSISEEEIQQFEEDGAIVLRQLFASDWLEKLCIAAEDNMKKPGPLCDEHEGPNQPGRFHDDQFLWQRHETMHKFVHESPAAHIAKRMMRGKEVRLFYDQLFVKEPDTSSVTPWHNDHSYWQLKGQKIVSVWLALDSIPESACLKYVKGSHKWNLLHRISSFSGNQDRYKSSFSESLPAVPDIDAMHDKVELLKWKMEPGDCLVHHSFAVHGAPGISANSSRRRAYATRWVGDDVTFDPRPGTMHYVWLKAGLDPGLQPGSPLKSSIFPEVH